jgi:integrase/recombinase XerD
MSALGWIERFLVWVRRRGSPGQTLKAYRSYLKVFAGFLQERSIDNPVDVDRSTIAAFEAYLMTYRSQRERPYSTGTRAHVVAAIRKLYAHLIEENRILVDPTLGMKAPRTIRRMPRGLMTAAEMHRLLTAPDVTTAWGLRDRAILELLYGTGLRFAELANLSVGDVDLVEKILWVRHGKGGRDRVLPLGRWATHWVGRYLEASDELRRRQATARVFLTPRGNRLANTVLNWLLGRYARRVGIAKPVTAHAIRHTMATLLIKRGADVRKLQELLGHRNLNTTEWYTHLTVEDLRRVQKRFHPRERS